MEKNLSFVFSPGMMQKIRWSSRGSCGEPGCKDPECCCAVCSLPVGLAEDDSAWETHSDECEGNCPVCVDQVPVILFRDEGRNCLQAVFHQACFESAVEFVVS